MRTPLEKEDSFVVVVVGVVILVGVSVSCSGDFVKVVVDVVKMVGSGVGVVDDVGVGVGVMSMALTSMVESKDFCDIVVILIII